MAQATAIRLSGERLTVADVWLVACRNAAAAPPSPTITGL